MIGGGESGRKVAYQLQDTVVVIGEGFVPRYCQPFEEEGLGLEKQTITHTPLRSRIVLSGGAAIVTLLGKVVSDWWMRDSEKWWFLKK